MHLEIKTMNFYDNGKDSRGQKQTGTILECEAVYNDKDYEDYTHIKIGEFFRYTDKYQFEIEKIRVSDDSVIYTLKEKPLRAEFHDNNFYKHLIGFKNSLSSIIGDRLIKYGS